MFELDEMPQAGSHLVELEVKGQSLRGEDRSRWSTSSIKTNNSMFGDLFSTLLTNIGFSFHGVVVARSLRKRKVESSTLSESSFFFTAIALKKTHWKCE